MNDISRHLPLSQRTKDDESAVTSDWRPQTAASLRSVAAMLAFLTPEQWEASSLRAGWTVRQVACHLLWRLNSPTGLILREKALRRNDPHSTDATVEEVMLQLDEAAERFERRRGRKGVSELAEVVIHGYDIARSLGTDLAFVPTVTGAVALGRAAAAPTGIRAVIRDRTLVATDAGWRIGHGADLEGTAEALILFLYGRTTKV